VVDESARYLRSVLAGKPRGNVSGTAVGPNALPRRPCGPDVAAEMPPLVL